MFNKVNINACNNNIIKNEDERSKYNIDIGIINLGFTCYLNSIIQILFHFNEFRESILLCEVDDTENNVLNELVIFFDGLKNKTQKYYNPISFINNFDD